MTVFDYRDTVGVQVIQLKDLKKIAPLGAGAFGQVFLVKHNTKYYALKCLSKALVVETGLQVGSCPSWRGGTLLFFMPYREAHD